MSSFTTNIALFQKYLDTRVKAHAVYTNNVANAETDNFKAQVPTFEAKLETAKTQMIDGELTNAGQKEWNFETNITKSKNPTNSSGNNVQLDQELSNLSQNSLLYISGIKLLNKQLAIERYAITGGR